MIAPREDTSGDRILTAEESKPYREAIIASLSKMANRMKKGEAARYARLRRSREIAERARRRFYG